MCVRRLSLSLTRETKEYSHTTCVQYLEACEIGKMRWLVIRRPNSKDSRRTQMVGGLVVSDIRRGS
jgi:hypothetical protein